MRNANLSDADLVAYSGEHLYYESRVVKWVQMVHRPSARMGGALIANNSTSTMTMIRLAAKNNP
jgi:hypothetical protein